MTPNDPVIALSQNPNTGTDPTLKTFDFDAAHRDGWTISDLGRFKDGTPHVELQKLDRPHDGTPRFYEDKEAWAHVVQKAREGSSLHLDALDLIDRRERLAIETLFGPW